MLNISIKNYRNAEVYTVTIDNGKLFWVKMNDVQKRLGEKNMPDLLRKEIHGIYNTRNPRKEQIMEYKRRGKEFDNDLVLLFVMFVIILYQE